MNTIAKCPKAPLDNELHYQQVRVMNRFTGKATTISIDRVTYIHLCRSLRSLDAVNSLARKMALEIELVPGQPLSGQVARALTKHADRLRAQSA